MSIATITEQFARRSAELPGTGAIAELRRTALERFTALGFPGRKLETWRYTDLTSVADRAYDYIGTPPDTALIAAAGAAVESLGLDAGVPRLVFVDGCLHPELSTHSGRDGIRVMSLADQPGALLNEETAAGPALAALNQAFVRDGASIRFGAGGPAQLALIFVGSGRALASQIRLRFELDRRAQAIVTEEFIDLNGDAQSWLNLVTDIALDEDSRLEHYRLQRHGSGRIATGLRRARLAAGAELVSGAVETGGRLVRNELEIRLDGPRATASVSGLALTSERQHCDTRIDVDHRAAHTTSRQDYRAIADGRSRSVFNGKVTVREGAQHIDARQRNDNLLLSPQAEIDTKPELEIYADQVACSHGATIGELGEEPLFYLRSRGIDEITARGILTTAFAGVVIDRFPLESFRSRARTAVALRLPQPIAPA